MNYENYKFKFLSLLKNYIILIPSILLIKFNNFIFFSNNLFFFFSRNKPCRFSFKKTPFAFFIRNLFTEFICACMNKRKHSSHWFSTKKLANVTRMMFQLENYLVSNKCKYATALLQILVCVFATIHNINRCQSCLLLDMSHQPYPLANDIQYLHKSSFSTDRSSYLSII